LSFKDVVTFSMVASADKEHIETNTIPVSKKPSLTKSSVIYGANASGKSNLLKAMSFMKHIILNISKESQSNEKIPIEKFRLSTETDDLPSTFEATFLIDKVLYRYGFQVDEKKVQNEWLFFVPSMREATLFIREGDNIKLGSYFKEGKGLESKTRPNSLFLSVVDQFNGEISKKIIKWFSNLNKISGLREHSLEAFSVSMLDDGQYKKFLNKFLHAADIGIKYIKTKSTANEKRNFPLKVPQELMEILKKETDGKFIEVTSIHQKYDKDNNPISDESFSFSGCESAGTRALFAFSGPLYDTLINNGVLVIDELTAKLHPLITRAIVEFFHHYNDCKDKDSKSNAQLIFASHDTNILTNQYFRRDQIWFTEKDRYGATDLFSLEEIKIRKDASFNKDYIMGKYGAIPFIGDIQSLL
jgi:uncharacterized protein